MDTFTSHPRSAAALGILLALPFVILNAIVANRVEPFFSIIRPGVHTSSVEYALLALALGLIPTGAFIAVRPVLRKASDGTRSIYLLNGVVAAVLLLMFAALAIGLGWDIYRCDFLKVPNCD